MKRIIVNKDSKVLFNYKGIDYLVENYQTMGSYGQKIEAYDLYDSKTKGFLFFQGQFLRLKRFLQGVQGILPCNLCRVLQNPQP